MKYLLWIKYLLHLFTKKSYSNCIFCSLKVKRPFNHLIIRLPTLRHTETQHKTQLLSPFWAAVNSDIHGLSFKLSLTVSVARSGLHRHTLLHKETCRHAACQDWRSMTAGTVTQPSPHRLCVLLTSFTVWKVFPSPSPFSSSSSSSSSPSTFGMNCHDRSQA